MTMMSAAHTAVGYAGVFVVLVFGAGIGLYLWARSR